MKKKPTGRLPGLLLTGLLLLILVVFMVILANTKLLPIKFLLLIGGVFALLTVCVFFLTRDSHRLGRVIIGCLLMLTVLAVLILGADYISRAKNTLDKITQVDVEIAEVGIYVMHDDAADTLEELKEYRFGVLEMLDRENSDKTIAKLEDRLNTDLQISEYTGLAELADGLLKDRTVDAIILNSAYLEVMAEMEGFQL